MSVVRPFNSSILDLPDDVLIVILKELTIPSLIVIQQTCRALHAFCSSDYLWHSIDIDLPLNIGSHVRIKALKGSELRRLIVDALRVEYRWGRQQSVPKNIQRIQHGGIISDMCLLSSEWLVTLSRSSTGRNLLSIWHIRQDSSMVRTRLVTIEATRPPKFTASIEKEGTELTVAVYFRSVPILREELLRIYVFPLGDMESNSQSDSSRYLSCQILGNAIHGIAYEAHICENHIAVGLALFSNVLEPPTYQILLAETKTGFYRIMTLQTPQPSTHMYFRLLPEYLVVTGIHKDKLVFQKYIWEGLSFSETSGSLESTELNPALDQLVSNAKVTSSPGFDYTLSGNPFARSFDSITALTYHQSPAFRHIIRFPLNSRNEVTAQSLPSEVVGSDILCIGPSGRRAVWLERRWDTDSFILMKGSFPPGNEKPIVAPLVPPHVALPFEFHACQSLAFDEATGRVCVGLHTGDVYLLYF